MTEKSEPVWNYKEEKGHFKTELYDSDDEVIIKRSYDSSSESDNESDSDDTPLSDLFKLDVKLEPVDVPVRLPDGTTIPVSDVEVKKERDLGPESAAAKKVEYCFKCRICSEIFNSRYSFAVHINKHEVKCVNCKCKYETWKKLEEHEIYCTRRFGRILIPRRIRKKPEPKKKLPFKCCLCHRKYEKYQHLFNHQVKRCKKRYLRPQWVVKI